VDKRSSSRVAAAIPSPPGDGANRRRNNCGSNGSAVVAPDDVTWIIRVGSRRLQRRCPVA
jgi:hypothetical protein